MSAPDPKPVKRLVSPKNLRAKLQSERACRSCGEPATEAHHVLRRSQGGDDIPDNLMALCMQCHRDYHDGRLNRIRIRQTEVLYMRGKLGRDAGEDYLQRHYGYERSV